MNFLKNFRKALWLLICTTITVKLNVPGKPHLGKRSPTKGVQTYVIAGMALLVGRDGCKVISPGDSKIKIEKFKVKKGKINKNKNKKKIKNWNKI